MKLFYISALGICIVSGIAWSLNVPADSKAVKLMDMLKKNDPNSFSTFYKESENNSLIGNGLGSTFTNKEYRKGQKSRHSVYRSEDKNDPGIHDIDDGTDSWMINSFVGKQKLDKNENKLKNRMNQDFFGNASYCRYTGTERLNNLNCYTFEVGLKNSSGSKSLLRAKLWVSINSYDVLQASSVFGTSVFSDFRAVKDKRFAFSINIFLDGRKIGEQRVKIIKINEPIDDQVFNPDAFAVKAVSLPKYHKDPAAREDEGVTPADDNPTPLLAEDQADLAINSKAETGKKVLKGALGLLR
jgi:hypothetical protein